MNTTFEQNIKIYLQQNQEKGLDVYQKSQENVSHGMNLFDEMKSFGKTRIKVRTRQQKRHDWVCVNEM